ncbi:uncharacterized protein LTR77_006745 [Saxophila tyrrhenica]|uniref:Amidohydrolase-related domain-containing protein n=1 Tax=Saxophila tyrrhenica TaxID=1690608 RepID=A0AAV9P7Q3_9PEZI|nr:hypothetical protein LTR77_006745 [Saxophila tyrrhenica]
MDDWEIVAPMGDSRSGRLSESHEEHKNEDDTTGIFASLLIPGRGDPMKDQAILCSRKTGKIIYVGLSSRIPPKYYNVHLEKIPVVMPGMWECHAHFMGASPNKPIDFVNLALTSPPEAGARNARVIKDTLYAGFTSAVELGGYATELQRVIEEGSILGPTLYGSGGAISMTAGHGDIFELPYGCSRQKLSVNAPGTDGGAAVVVQADGVDECRKAVRLNLRRGAKCIKVLTSGGVTSRDDRPEYQQLSDEELKVIVEEAGRMGMICAAHAEGKAGIMAAIRAGFKVIEHGSYADDEVYKEMKKNDVMLVATITPLESILDNKDKYPPAMYRKTAELAKIHMAAYRNAVKAGIRCALGSDLFGGPGSVLSPGMNGNEVHLAVKTGGMTPLQAIEAATANGPLTLGPQAPQSGQIKEGYDADLLGLDKNPLDDIEMMRKPKNVKYIWKQGKLVKAPGLDPWDALDI